MKEQLPAIAAHMALLTQPPLQTLVDVPCSDPALAGMGGADGRVPLWMNNLLALASNLCTKLDAKAFSEADVACLQRMFEASKSITRNAFLVQQLQVTTSFASSNMAGVRAVVASGIVPHLLGQLRVQPVVSIRSALLVTLGGLMHTLAAPLPNGAGAGNPWIRSAAAVALERGLVRELLQYDLSCLAAPEVLSYAQSRMTGDTLTMADGCHARLLANLAWHPSLSCFQEWLARQLMTTEELVRCDGGMLGFVVSVALCQESALRPLTNSSASTSGSTASGAGTIGSSTGGKGLQDAPAQLSYAPNGTSPLLEALLVHGLRDYIRTAAGRLSDADCWQLLHLAGGLALAFPCRFRSLLVAEYLERARCSGAAGQRGTARSDMKGRARQAAVAGGSSGGGGSALVGLLVRAVGRPPDPTAVHYALPMRRATLLRFLQVRTSLSGRVAEARAH